jgi:hypothetical protein
VSVQLHASAAYIIRLIKSKRMRGATCPVARMGDMRNVYKTSVEKPARKTKV